MWGDQILYLLAYQFAEFKHRPLFKLEKKTLNKFVIFIVYSVFIKIFSHAVYSNTVCWFFRCCREEAWSHRLNQKVAPRRTPSPAASSLLSRRDLLPPPTLRVLALTYRAPRRSELTTITYKH